MKEILHALIVEDSQEDTDSLLLTLKRSGYEIEHQRVETAEALNIALDRKAGHSLQRFHDAPVQRKERLWKSSRNGI
jgi:hypothetical protein